ncbi:hypothetical protein GDO86_016658 [Hymenochirus boettgeri]|uniref:NACHT domain-containing protein n=1 Tax=Hymenochirus boettgeri TaxID=247094 RepID=A0A8T2K5Y9_9PIPI|nr:hypothetical protein GDO86_016658 [Hymenochirus boettgeri]
MDTSCERIVTEDDIQKFRQHLNQYEDCQLNLFFKYFWDEAKYIIESLDAQSILRELNFRNICRNQDYMSIIKECGISAFTDMLLQDILDHGRDAMLGFWESLYYLQNDYPHPNLLAMLGELQTGIELEKQINIDKFGYDLQDDLKVCQTQHKGYLERITENLTEHTVPELRLPGQREFPISERYLDLIVVSNQQLRNRSENEVVTTGGIHEHHMYKAQSNLERIALNRLFRWCHRSEREPKVVLVTGVPGVGKTTLVQKFVYDWSCGQLYQRFNFVFFFKFRNLDLMKELNLAKLISDEYPYLYSKCEGIFRDPEKLLFIFDGLDERTKNVDFDFTHLCSDPLAMENLWVIISSLVKQTLLKGCSVLITSRPNKLATTETQVFHRLSEIMGFFPRQREMYFMNFYRDNVMANKAFTYVRENGILYTFCYIPSYCWIICTVLALCFKKHEKNNAKIKELFPQTVTQLFAMYVDHILTNHSINQSPVEDVKKVMTSMGWLAEYGVMDSRCTFDNEHFASFNVNISSSLLSSFMVESVHPGHVTYSFTHLTIQEFCSALVHYLDYNSEKLQNVLEKAKYFEDDGHYEIFLRFMSGLSDTFTRSLLRRHLGNTSSEAARIILLFLQTSISREVQEGGLYLDKRKTLNMFACLTESRNPELVCSALGANTNFDFADFHLAPLDCTVLKFIIECCKETELLDVSSGFIESEGLERLTPALHTVKDLRLINNNLQDKDMEFIYQILTHPSCRIEKLNLKINGLTESCCCPLAVAISENKSMRELDLSKNKLAGEGFSLLLEVLSNPHCRIENLGLQEIKLSPEYASSLFSLTNNKNLTHLNISSNFFADVGYPNIQNLILKHPSLKEIRVGMNDFSQQNEQNLQRLKTNVKIIL